MKKALFVATIMNFLGGFEFNDVKILQSMGYEVHCAANMDLALPERIQSLQEAGAILHNVSFARKLKGNSNLNAFKQIRAILSENDFDVIHVHTPIASVITRYAARNARKKGTIMVYTAHGFHFFTGAPIKNWLIYFTAEWICSWFTDVIITMNEEDYARAKRRMHSKNVKYIHGVGVDTSKFERDPDFDVEKKREELGIDEKACVLLSVGELVYDKNQQIIIKTLASINDPNIHYFLAGVGSLREQLEALAVEYGVSDRVHFLGYRRDVPELLWASDVFVFPSIFEGLPVSLMEAIAAGKAIACSSCRGNTDLIKNKKYLFKHNSEEQCKTVIEFILNNDNTEFIRENKVRLRSFQKDNVSKEMRNIYVEVVRGKD